MFNLILFLLLLAIVYMVVSGDGFYKKYADINFVMASCFLLILPIFFIGLYFIGFRPLDAGYDTASYIRAYTSLGDFFEARDLGRVFYGNSEILWWPLHSLFSNFLDPRSWLIFNYLIVFLLAFITYRVVARGCQFSPIIFIFIFSTYYFVYSGNAMRQVYSIPIIFLSVYFFDRSKLLSILLLLLASSFHLSSLIFLFYPLISNKVIQKKSVVLFFPFVIILFSIFFQSLADFFVGLVDIEDLSNKRNLYFDFNRVSHVGDVWLTVNFWLCTVASFLYMLCVSLKKIFYDFIYPYVFFVLSIILFGTSIPDFSERYFPLIFFIYPIIIFRIINIIPTFARIKNKIYISFFVILFCLVLSADSSSLTLGY